MAQTERNVKANNILGCREAPLGEKLILPTRRFDTNMTVVPTTNEFNTFS